MNEIKSTNEEKLNFLKSIAFILVVGVALFIYQGRPFGVEDFQGNKIYFAEEVDWAPFTPNKTGLATEGLSYDLMREIFSRLDLEVEIELFPQKRMIELIKKGDKDGATVISKNAQRLKFIDYTDSIFQKKGLLYFLEENDHLVDWQSYEELKGLKIGVVAGHNYGDKFNKAVKKFALDIYPVTHIDQNFEKLIHGRIDLLLCIEATANHYLSFPKYKDKIIASSKGYYEKGYYIGFSKLSNARHLIPRVNKVIREMKKDGSLKKIRSKYGLD